jgi:CRISPR/Cas system CMR-associated protein Cmr3 (group 5 of RAMP superfamily)
MKHDIKDKTSSGKPVTYKKLKNRIQNHKNVSKKRRTNGIMSLMIAYLDDRIDHDELMSKLNEKISFHELDRQPALLVR